MSGERLNLGFGEDLDLSDFQPQARTKQARLIPKEEATNAAAALGFTSREATQPKQDVAAPAEPTQAKGPMRRRRTGRNAQLNIKAKPDTIAEYCEIADKMGWGLGETLEMAVAALQAKLKQG